MKTTAEILAKAADLAHDDPENWPRQFERYDAELMRWCRCHSERHFFFALKEKRGVRLAPKTFSFLIEDMPTPLKQPPGDGEDYWIINPANQTTQGMRWGRNHDHHETHLYSGMAFATRDEAKTALRKITEAMKRS